MYDKYGIELDLILGKFKQKIQEVKSAFKGVENKKINVNANTAQIENVKSQIKEIQYLLGRADKGFEVGDTLKLQAQLEKLTNQYNKLISKQNEVSVASKKVNEDMSKGFNKMTSKVKRFGLSLLSIRSIFSLVSKASSAYLAQDTELAKKLQSVWAGLGSLLAPIIEGITNILLKAVAYINIFIKALTGVDLLAKASAKSMKAAAGSAKALNRALAGFDDLQNLDTDVGGGTGGIGGAFSAFENLDLPWADKIEKFAEKVRKVYDFLHKIGGDKGAIENFKEIYERLKKIGGEKGAYQNFKEIYDKLKEIGGEKGAFQNFKQIYDKLKETGLEKGAFLNYKQIYDKLKEIGGDKGAYQSFKEIYDKLKETGGDKSAYENFKNIYNKLKEIGGDNGAYTNFKLIKEKLNEIGLGQGAFENLNRIYNKLKEIGGDKGAVSNLKLIIEKLKGLNSNSLWEGIKIGFQNFKKWLYDNIIEPIRKWFDNLFKGIEKSVNNLRNSLSKLDFKSGSISLISKAIPKYDVGTNYVPEDQLAFIHKGEAIIPKKYNNDGYTPNNNEETNVLLGRVIEAINNIEINPYTTVKDVGKASLSYINNKSRQLGESVIY